MRLEFIMSVGLSVVENLIVLTS